MKCINCPNCGGSVELEENGVYAACQFCGSKMYFKDNEIHLLTEKIYKMNEYIEKDEHMTENARITRLSAMICIFVSSVLYVMAAVNIVKTTDDINSYKDVIGIVGPWFGGALLLLLGVIITAMFYKGYDVYNNKKGGLKNYRIKFALKYILLGKLINYVFFIIAGIVSGL